MGCGRIENGRVSFPALWRLEDNVVGAGAIDFTWSAPTWVRMLMITANWEAVPTVAEDLVLWKNHAGTAWDVDLLRVDPFALGLEDWQCVEHLVFAPGEEARIEYPNSDDQDVGVEIYFQQINKG